MERIDNFNGESQLQVGWEAWDAVPRDGPAVFVIDTAALERQHQLHGRWIDLGGEETAVQAQLAELVGPDPAPGSWAIVDQVGLGPRMAPETLDADQLHRLPQLMDEELG